jgi:hypothetical protein
VRGVRAAAAAKDNQARQKRCQPGVAGRQRVEIAAIEIRGLVDFGAASFGRVVPDADTSHALLTSWH